MYLFNKNNSCARNVCRYTFVPEMPCTYAKNTKLKYYSYAIIQRTKMKKCEERGPCVCLGTIFTYNQNGEADFQENWHQRHALEMEVGAVGLVSENAPKDVAHAFLCMTAAS